MILICACCGGRAPARHQWYNRDTGYGVCRSCWESSVAKLGIEESIRLYGAPGIHHSTEETANPPLKTVQALRLAEGMTPLADLVSLLEAVTPTTEAGHAPTLPEHVRQRLHAKVRQVFKQEFNEADCGGAFDGFQVTSDADPGL